MRYSKDHKEQTRRRILDTAARAFRRDGIDATGVAGLMAEAGLTQGGFYTHFRSKDSLVAEVIDDTLAQTRRNCAERIAQARKAGKPPLGAVIDAYLSEYHLQSRDISCSLAALGSELGHQSDEGRRVAERRIRDISELFAAELPEGQAHRAGPLFAMMAGTLQMAWLATTSEESGAILANGRRVARELAGIADES